MTYSLIQVGADVEVFCRDQNGKPAPVCGLLGGTKAKPIMIDEAWHPWSAYQEDNVMPEFNVTPSSDPTDFAYETRWVLSHVIAKLKKKGLVVDIVPSMEFATEQLQSEQAQHVGCSPDQCAWSMETNPTVSPELLGNIRTAGGHVHVSFMVDGQVVENFDKLPDGNIHQCRIVRMMDLFLGVPSVIIDQDLRRKQFYGKAGAYRPKPFGVEYRVLSNFWIRNRRYNEWVYSATQRAIQTVNTYMEHGGNGTLPPEECKRIIKCINTQDVKEAYRIVGDYGLSCPK